MTSPLPQETALPRRRIALFVLKLAAALLIAFFLFSLLVYTVITVGSNDFDLTDAELIGWCESDYYARDYAALYETLLLFDLYDEKYAVYWEAVAGYEASISFLQWQRAAQQGVPGAAEQAARQRDALAALAAAPAFEKNAALLQGLLQSLPDAP